MLFVDVSRGWPGSIHDDRVLHLCRLYREAGNRNMLSEPVRVINGCNIRPQILGGSCISTAALAYDCLAWSWGSNCSTAEISLSTIKNKSDSGMCLWSTQVSLAPSIENDRRVNWSRSSDDDDDDDDHNGAGCRRAEDIARRVRQAIMDYLWTFGIKQLLCIILDV